ncbi:hypothetical protein EJB05_42108, partial [Eragrostis curvula]
MANQQLLVIAVVASVFLTAVDVSASTAYDVLVKNNLPRGLFPKGVQSYVLRLDGRIDVTLPSDCNVFVTVGGQQTKLQFPRKFGGVVRPGSISGVYGIILNVESASLGISQIQRAGDLITITAKNSRLSIPVSSFAQSPSCS